MKAANVNGAADIWKVQVDLPKGAKVEIVGEEGSYYKIVTPPNVSVYLPPGSVRRLEASFAATTPAPVAAKLRNGSKRSRRRPRLLRQRLR